MYYYIENFMNAPSLKDERPVSHDDVKMRGCILYISQTHQNLYYAAWFKDGAKLANGTLYLRQNNRRRVSGLSIKNISYQDEGNYQCVLYKNNRPIAYSTEFSLKLYGEFMGVCENLYKICGMIFHKTVKEIEGGTIAVKLKRFA